jgi:hypothetical protein
VCRQHWELPHPYRCYYGTRQLSTVLSQSWCNSLCFRVPGVKEERSLHYTYAKLGKTAFLLLFFSRFLFLIILKKISCAFLHVVLLLCSHITPPLYTNTQNMLSPLNMAAASSRLNSIRLLLERGADVNDVDRVCHTYIYVSHTNMHQHRARTYNT